METAHAPLPPNTRPGKPRTIWVFGLAFFELGITILAALISSRLGLANPTILAPIAAILASGYLGYRREMRAPGQLTLLVRAHLAVRVSLLLGVMNGAALYYQTGTIPLSKLLLITGFGTIFLAVVHFVGLQAGVSTGKMVNQKRA